MKISKIISKDVVDVNTANKLGRIKDFKIDLVNGKIESVDIVLNLKVSNLLKNNKFIVPWDKIKSIGDKVILIDYQKNNI